MFKCWQMIQLSLQKNLCVGQTKHVCGQTSAVGPPDCGLGLNAALPTPTHSKEPSFTHQDPGLMHICI